MKLYERELVRCVLVCAEIVDDGEGGAVLSITEGPEFKAALIEKKVKVTERGGQRLVWAEYDAVIPSEYGVVLENGDRFTTDDGKIYTVVGEGKTPPSVSVIRFNQYSAEALAGEVMS